MAGKAHGSDEACTQISSAYLCVLCGLVHNNRLPQRTQGYAEERNPEHGDTRPRPAFRQLEYGSVHLTPGGKSQGSGADKTYLNTYSHLAGVFAKKALIRGILLASCSHSDTLKVWASTLLSGCEWNRNTKEVHMTWQEESSIS